MNYNQIRCFGVAFVVLILFVSFGSAGYAIDESSNVKESNNNVFPSLKAHIDITVQEAWELLSSTNNGIQIPVDVRTPSEWADERIDTPHPENPKHHCLSDIQDPVKLTEFMELYEGQEIILYCLSGGRSLIAADVLVDNEFSGVIYNMLGGISAWKSAGFPTITDQPPELDIINPKEGYFHFSGVPLIPTQFDLLANTVSFGGFRVRPIIINATDDIDNRENLTVTVYLNDVLQGETIYCCDWNLHEWFWTGLALGNYKLKITAKDLGGNSNSVEINVWNFCFIP